MNNKNTCCKTCQFIKFYLLKKILEIFQIMIKLLEKFKKI